MIPDIRIEDYNYPLPDERIAKYPLAERDSSKLLRYIDGKIYEFVFRQIPELLPSEAAADVDIFLKQLAKAFPDVPVTLEDERFTSVLAHRAMIDGGMKASDRRDKASVDKISAAIILQGYLDRTGDAAGGGTGFAALSAPMPETLSRNVSKKSGRRK